MRRKRVYAIFSVLILLFCGVGIRLLQLSDDALKTASNQQSTRAQTIAVSRGTIYDRYQEPLVNTRSEIVASIAPYEECVTALRKQLPPSESSDIIQLFEEQERPIVRLSRWLPPTIGVAQVEVPLRYDNVIAPHIIGYVDGEYNGVTGIEKGYDEQLSSYEGAAVVRYAIDALGRPMSAVDEEIENTLTVSAGGVALTLDAQVQTIVREVASAYMERGAVIVTDAQTAQVLASVSLPDYQPNDVADVLEDVGAPLLDRSRINYNCGSVFKIITAAAALENGITPDTTYTCTGEISVDGVAFACHNHVGSRTFTMREAMTCSCNGYFIQLALEVGAAAIHRVAEKAGWGEAFTLANGIFAAASVLPNDEDLSSNAALANFAIGQGDLLATPYHVHTLAQAVANGGLRQEMTLYYGRVDENGVLTPTGHCPEVTRIFSENTANVLADMMTAVVESGTGSAASPRAVKAAGKTGTAETGWLQNGDEVVQSWFTGYCTTDEPRYVITVLSENGGANGKTAAPLFAAIVNTLDDAGLIA